MKRFALFLVLCLVFVDPAWAQAPRTEAAWNKNIILQAISFEKITVPAASTGLSAGKLTPADAALKGLPTEVWLSFETNDVMMCLDGTAASATNCHTIPKGMFLTITGRDSLLAMRFFDAAGTAVVKVTYFRVAK